MTAPLPTSELASSVAGQSFAPASGSASFGVIYADPPWRYDNATPNRRIENHYPTMSDEEICAMQVPAAKDCILYLWACAPRLEVALDVMKAWGFRYKTQAVWDKVKVGMGYWFRGQHEILMVGTRGNVSPPPQPLRISSVIRSPRGRHSAKPDYVRDRIAAWYPDVPKLEMFSRLKRPGWDVFGNQVEYDLLSGDGMTPNAKSSDLRTETVDPASSANRRFAATPGSANVSGAPQQSGAGGEREETL